MDTSHWVGAEYQPSKSSNQDPEGLGFGCLGSGFKGLGG